MERKTTNGHIPIRGKQRTAVYNALGHPATGRQILESAKKVSPSMTYQDLRHILRDFEQKEIAVCLNPNCQTGRFYVLTVFAEKTPHASYKMELSAKVGRAKTRLAVLQEVAKERIFETHPLTATQIKKNMRESYSLGLNHVLTALKFLESHSLVDVAGYTAKRELKIYRITDLGKDILNQLSPSEKSLSTI